MLLRQPIFTWERMKLDPYLIPYTKINSRQIKVIAKTIKLLEKTGVNIQDNGCDNGFLDMTLKAQVTKENQVKMDLLI